ncbi:hypothetical protein BCF11_4027 [Collimonas sp. PA-H2]|uniref:hypothetical protein n=1 Tax=Collimonas sp. PA-H2 TaxID=1881062 RepID=UPI000BF83544|nr:hypothetical protein [Collimonas sp. PA-H2]PFH11575.1 hypothetical protein BCF11_4027 [Collimonas sp. PA-H2]
MKQQLSIAAIISGRFSSFVNPPQKKQGVPATGAPNVILRNPPPPAKQEAEPHARAGLVWSPGFWDYVDGWYVWEAGHWELARTDQHYLKPGWRKVIHGWELQRGEWRVTTVSFIRNGAKTKQQEDQPGQQYDPLAAFR